MMFSQISLIGSAKFRENPWRLRFSALSAKVDHFCLWNERDFPTRPMKSITPIRLFRIEKKPFVKTSNFLYGRFANQHAGADDEIHIANAVMPPCAIISEDGMIRQSGR